MNKKIKQPKKFNPHKHDAGTIHEWLESRGIHVHGVSVTDTTIDIDVDDDINIDLDAFEPPVDKRQQALDQLNTLDLDKANVRELASAIRLIRDILSSP